MRHLFMIALLVVSAHLGAAADQPGTFVLTSPPGESKTIPGFVTLLSSSTVWDVEATHIISVHRTKEQPQLTWMVIDVPLTVGQTHTHVIIPQEVMSHEKVLRFVQDQRFKPRQQ